MKTYLSIFIPLLAFTIILFSCDDVKISKNISYNTSKELKPILISPPNDEIIYPRGFSVIKSNLIVLDPKLETEKIKVFDNHDFKLLTSFGNEGNGLSEYSSNTPQPISIYPNVDIQVFDWVKKRIDLYELDSNGNELVATINNDYTLPPSLMLAQKSAFINDTTVLSSGGMGSGFIALTNTYSDKINFFNTIINNTDNYKMNELMILLDCDVSVNTEKQLIAVAPKYFPELFILNFEGEIVKKHTISEYNVVNIGDQKQENRMVFFAGASASSEYIYTTFIGKTFSEIDQEIDENEYNEINLSKVYVFNWDGDFVESYKLSGGFYNSLSIDEKNKKIYSLNDASPARDIVYFDLN